MQILHNLYQLGGDLCGLTHAGVDAGYEDANTYLLATPEGHLLFDCGCGGTWEQIEARIRYWGLEPGDIRHCLLTHAHLDHAGAAHRLAEGGVSILAHAETASAIAAADERCCGYLYHKTFTPCRATRILEDGERLVLCGVEIEVLHLPGHSMGCTAYAFSHEGRELLVSGDVIGTLLAGDFGWSGSIDFDKGRYLESLRRLAQRDPDIMLPGHGMIYFHRPRRRVEQVLNAALMQWR